MAATPRRHNAQALCVTLESPEEFANLAFEAGQAEREIHS